MMNEDLRWKWVDDLTFIEIINLVNIGIASYLTKVKVPNDLDINKHYIARKANMKMCLLRKVASFKPPRKDLRIIYIQYVRSILEQSCVV